MWLLFVFGGEKCVSGGVSCFLFQCPQISHTYRNGHPVNFISPACVIPKRFDDPLQIHIKSLQERFATIEGFHGLREKKQRELSSDTLYDFRSRRKKKVREHRWIWTAVHTCSTLISQIQRFQYCQFSLVSSKNHNDCICMFLGLHAPNNHYPSA